LRESPDTEEGSMTHDVEISPSSIAAGPFLTKQGESGYSSRLGRGCDYAVATAAGE
jgi:hypothetical protein